MLAELGWDSYHISRWADALLLSMFAGPAFYKPWRPYRSIQNPHLCCYLQLLKRTKWEKRNLVNTDIHAWVRKKKRLSYVWSVCHARGLFALRFAFSRLVYQGFKVRRLYLQCTCKFPLRDCFASCSQTFLYRDALYFIATCTSFRLNNSLRPYGPHPRVCKIIRQCYSTMLQY